MADNDEMKDIPPRDPGDLSLREAIQVASRLKVKAWIGLIGGVFALVTVVFTAGGWWEKHFGDRDSKQISNPPSAVNPPNAVVPPPVSTSNKSTPPGEARFLTDRRESRTRHGVTRIESTLNELPWGLVPPKRFGFVVIASDDALVKTSSSSGFDDDAANDRWLELHKLARDEYVALGYVSQADSRDLSLARTPSVIHLYTVPNEEAPVFVDNVALDRFGIVDDRMVGDNKGTVFDLKPLKIKPSNSVSQRPALKRHR